MRKKSLKRQGLLLCGTAAIVLALAGAAQAAEAADFNIPAQPLSTALAQFGVQSEHGVFADSALTSSKSTQGVVGQKDAEVALNELLAGTGLSWRRDGQSFVILRAADPQSGSAAGDGADAGTVQALIVTAQKKEEAIQDVPIAISAFTEKSLEEQKIEGGFDLLKAIPNVTFSKNNFTSYNFSIRGIGTKAVSATTDPGVAVAFNNAALIQNRLFEQEYFDVERVEVLRGPQGTLYGRNATAGVINVISAKPNLSEFDGWVKGEVGNYHAKRLSAMVNVPLVNDKLAIRFAGALTNRSGYDYNTGTNHAVNGRDLWSARVTVAFNPTDRLRTSFLWERFNENDNRSRTGKQLCKYDPGPTQIGDTMIGEVGQSEENVKFIRGAVFSQGCLPVSLYDKDAFQTPNGWAIPFYWGMQVAGNLSPIGATQPQGGDNVPSIVSYQDPYGGMPQSPDLRVINSIRDPIYRAKADVFQFGVDYDLTDSLRFSFQTTYDKDQVYSFQDYNRFNTVPIFIDTSNIYDPNNHEESSYRNLSPGGIFCDPQIGCSKSIAGFDISKAKSSQFLQEVRLSSNFDGPLNFSVGANYTKFNVLVDYYVMFNILSAFAQVFPFDVRSSPIPASPDTCDLRAGGGFFSIFPEPISIDDPRAGCPYIDPNPVENINGEGHNYFRSKNPYKLKSAAVFGEMYWQATDALKVTAGLRYTDDRKTFTPVPSQALLGTGLAMAGDVNRGYPALPDIKQHWGEVTGRLGVDWKPDLSWTDQTMLYAFYSRGYKGGGANPPGIGFSKTPFLRGRPAVDPVAQNASPTFKPEFVNAFEVGAKNTLLGGGLTFNTDAFFYDYKDYQVSKIVDRTAANENFDARVWGLEFETTFAPTRNLRFVGNLGYLDTSIGKGAKSIDIMNRTQGNTNYILTRPWAQLPSNCIVPKTVVEAKLIDNGGAPGTLFVACGWAWIGAFSPLIDPATGEQYDPANYPEINGGAGIFQNLEGNELPNSPHWTANLGAQYGFDFADGWKATIRADGYWQSQSWARVYNAVNDKLHGWYNANLSLWLERPDDGLKIELYAKNILDKTPITDAFLNSDDTVLTTNVFVLDPRLIGLSIKKEF